VFHFHGQAISSANLAIIPSPSITVYHAGTTVLATIYSDDGVTVKANPFTGDSLGRYDFYAPDSRYDIAIAGTGITGFTLTNVTIADPLSAAWAFNVDTVELGVANARYNRQTAQWNRVDIAKHAAALVSQVSTTSRILSLFGAGPGANPITWILAAQVDLATGKITQPGGAGFQPPFLSANLQAENGAVVTLTGGASVTIATLNCGTLAVGDLVLMSGVAEPLKGATGGTTYIAADRDSGTATMVGAVSAHNVYVQSINQPANELHYFSPGGILRCTVAGTLTIRLRGFSAGSNATCAAGTAGIRAIVLRP